jgi:hypothetical protein
MVREKVMAEERVGRSQLREVVTVKENEKAKVRVSTVVKSEREGQGPSSYYARGTEARDGHQDMVSGGKRPEGWRGPGRGSGRQLIIGRKKFSPDHTQSRRFRRHLREFLWDR